jgi:hypothetical protein
MTWFKKDEELKWFAPLLVKEMIDFVRLKQLLRSKRLFSFLHGA